MPAEDLRLQRRRAIGRRSCQTKVHPCSCRRRGHQSRNVPRLWQARRSRIRSQSRPSPVECDGRGKDCSSRQYVATRECPQVGVSGHNNIGFSSDLVDRMVSTVWGIVGVQRATRRRETMRFCGAGLVAAEGVSAAAMWFGALANANLPLLRGPSNRAAWHAWALRRTTA